MRTGGRAPAGSFHYEGEELVTTWHAHELHQVEYAFHGTLEVESAGAHYLLPPQQAAWIPSGVEHRTTIRSSVRTISVFFEAHLVPAPGERVRILAVPPVLREMLVYAGRWPIGRSASDPVSRRLLRCLGATRLRTGSTTRPRCFLPTSSDPVLAGALDWTAENLRTATVGAVARHVGLSERSLRRHFDAELGMSWRRLLRPGPAASSHGPAGRTQAVDPRRGDGCRFRQRQLVQPRLSHENGRDAVVLSEAPSASRGSRFSRETPASARRRHDAKPGAGRPERAAPARGSRRHRSPHA